METSIFCSPCTPKPYIVKQHIPTHTNLPNLGKFRTIKPVRAAINSQKDHTSDIKTQKISGPQWLKVAKQGLAALALTTMLQTINPTAVNASEFDILSAGPPTESHIIDDAGVLSRITKADMKGLLNDLESRKGFHIDLVTLRKLTTKPDAFEFADQVLEKWYPSVEVGNNKGLVLLVTSQKEGAVTGGPAFVSAVGDKVLEGVVAENLPVLATDEKYNEAIVSTAKRLVAVINGLPDPGGPKFQEKKRESNYKTKQETEEKRGQFVAVVGGLLVIAFVVPMAQYYAYVSRK